MFFIPGFLISIATFPGVIVHELAHQLFCRISKVAVFEVCYFRFGNPAGYVSHEIPKKLSQQIWISVGPFILNTVVGALIALPAAIPVLYFKDSSSIINYVLIWLGVSIAMHSFPSRGDAKCIWDMVRSNEASISYKIFATPIVGLIYIGAFGSVAWLDLIYGTAVALAIPKLLMMIMS